MCFHNSLKQFRRVCSPKFLAGGSQFILSTMRSVDRLTLCAPFCAHPIQVSCKTMLEQQIENYNMMCVLGIIRAQNVCAALSRPFLQRTNAIGLNETDTT